MSNDQHSEEERTGRLLAEGLQELAAGTPCLNENQLNSLAADTMPEAEKELSLSHVAGCAVCRHAFVVTQRLEKADVPDLPKHVRPAWTYTVPLALAATLLLAIGLYRLVPRCDKAPIPEIATTKPPDGQIAKEMPASHQAEAPKEIAGNRKPKNTLQYDLLAKADAFGKSIQGKSIDIPFVSAHQAGFASNGATEADRFHAGFAMYSLGVACDAKDRNMAIRAAASLDERLQRLDLPKLILEQFAHQINTLTEEDTLSYSCREACAVAYKALEYKFPSDPYVQLGAWTVSVRMSAQIKKMQFLTYTALGTDTEGAEKLELPGGVVEKIAEITDISNGTLDDAAWDRLDSLADDIQKSF